MEYSEITQKEKLGVYGRLPLPLKKKKKDSEWIKGIRLLHVFQIENFGMGASCYSRKTGKSDWHKAGEGSKRGWRYIYIGDLCILPRNFELYEKWEVTEDFQVGKSPISVVLDK